MKNSKHHNENIRRKAIREAQKEEQTHKTPEDLIENTHFKKQFDANHVETLPHKEEKKNKKHAKRTSTKDVKHETEPDHLHHQNEKSHSITNIKTEEKRQRFSHKDSKYKK